MTEDMHNTNTHVRLSDHILNQHVIVTGQSGSGKSLLLAKLIAQQLALSTGNLQGLVNALPVSLSTLLRRTKEKTTQD